MLIQRYLLNDALRTGKNKVNNDTEKISDYFEKSNLKVKGIMIMNRMFISPLIVLELTKQ